MYKNILVPLDGSKLAEKPLDYAGWLAGKSGASINLLRVYPGRIPLKTHYLQGIADMLEKKAAAQRDGQNSPDIRIESVSGDPASQILDYIERKNIDLVIMSTHGHTGFRQLIMGSVADRVVNFSQRPVRLMRSFYDKATSDTEYDRKVLVLLDGSELAEQILPFAAFHAQLSEGELVLLSVCEPPEVEAPLTYHLIPQGYPPKRPLQWEEYARQETEKREKECHLYLELQKEEHAAKKYTVRYEYLFGNAADEITKYLESNPVSLVAMTTRGRSGLTRLVFGSVAERVLAAARSPVLIMRPHMESAALRQDLDRKAVLR